MRGKKASDCCNEAEDYETLSQYCMKQRNGNIFSIIIMNTSEKMISEVIATAPWPEAFCVALGGSA